MKILAISDLHGNLNALEIFRKKIEKNNFDLVICAGDLTNFYFNPKETEKIPYFEEFIYNLKTPFIIVWGNRDFNKYLNINFPLKLVIDLDKEDYFYENWHFTSNFNHIASNSIFLTHSEIYIKNSNKPMLQLWGDSHIPKILYRPHICIDLGFLYRDSIHGANPILGLYWIIEINSIENITTKWYPLETSENSIAFFVKKVGKNEFILPWYLKDNAEYIKKIINKQ